MFRCLLRFHYVTIMNTTITTCTQPRALTALIGQSLIHIIKMTSCNMTDSSEMIILASSVEQWMNYLCMHTIIEVPGQRGLFSSITDNFTDVRLLKF